MGALMDYTIIDEEDFRQEFINQISKSNPGKIAILVDGTNGGMSDLDVSALTGIDICEIALEDLPDSIQDEISDLQDVDLYATLIFQNEADAREFVGKISSDSYAALNGREIQL